MSPPDVVIDPPEELRRVDALGEVVESGRGALPFWLVHGEPLVACAAWALGEAGVDLVDVGTPWADLVEDGRPLVLADPLCPLTPPDFVVACVELAETTGAVVVGVHRVTDTVKQVQDGYLGATIDRSDLLQVASPVVLPPVVVATLAGWPDDNLAALVASLAERFPVRSLVAPPEGRRVGSVEDLPVLQALTGR